jgi:hypothetical protein
LPGAFGEVPDRASENVIKTLIKNELKFNENELIACFGSPFFAIITS